MMAGKVAGLDFEIISKLDSYFLMTVLKSTTKNYLKSLYFSDFSVGAGKILFGAGLKVAGLATGNKGLTSAGGALVGAGVATSLGAHLFGKKK